MCAWNASSSSSWRPSPNSRSVPENRSKSILDPLVLARLQNLELRARTVVEGFISGLHQSPFRGYSLEFAEHREYSPGDEIRHIDWKVYGRTDRFFVKQFEQESNLRVNLLVDLSGSMNFRGGRAPLSKFDTAAVLAAGLAVLGLRQNDSAGLALLGESGVRSVPPRSSRSHLNVILDALVSASPGGGTALSRGLETVALSARKRGLFILFSDLLDDPGSVLRSLKFLQFKRNEIKVVQLLDPDELDFPFSGSVEFTSLEDGAKLVLDAGSYREDYRKAVRRLIERYRAALRDAGIEYYCHSTDEPPDAVLRSVLRSR